MEKRYILVHQSGHNDVWCNGSTHMIMGGNYPGEAPLAVKEVGIIVGIRFSKCDCKFWSQWNIPTDVGFPHVVAKGAKECIRGKK